MNNTLVTPNTIIRDFVRTQTDMEDFEFAERMGFHKSYISLVFNGHKPVTGEFMWRFFMRFANEDAPFYLPEANATLVKATQCIEDARELQAQA